MLKGISFCNPVDIDEEYLMSTIEYAHEKGFDHLQVIGPIHDYIKGNLEGITPYRKYSQFNDEADEAYREFNLRVLNEACKKASGYGMKTYMWHHELAMPNRFKEEYPEILNDSGDVEITHPLVKDFLEHKIGDFFHAYPYFDGIILTLHETQIPLLKLKNQKLGKIERVKYVTQILFDSCKALGKELIVRPFASLEEDYEMMTAAYESISTDLIIMDKWTQFDWSLTSPHNAFFSKIKKNPLLVEADIFGEFFGKGRLPLMLKDHIREKFAYCGLHTPAGYVARIDRNGEIPFGDVNEVNLDIYHSTINDLPVDDAIDAFFDKKYPGVGREVKELMLPTEEILKKTIYTNSYYFSELSHFPTLNHSKNHFYFEMMTKNYAIASNEWFIPRNWNRGPIDGLIAEKESAKAQAAELFQKLQSLKERISPEEYQKLWLKFYNLKLVTAAWTELLKVFVNYAGYFDRGDVSCETELRKALQNLLDIEKEGVENLPDKFYCLFSTDKLGTCNISPFVEEVRACFEAEKQYASTLGADKSLLDSIVCGGAMEGHKLQKEVNFSDTLMRDGLPCRIPDNRAGMEWSRITAHGWFSYEVKVTSNADNTICMVMDGYGGQLDVKIIIGEEEHVLSEAVSGKKEFRFNYLETAGKNTVRIRVEKTTGNVPCIFTISVLKG